MELARLAGEPLTVGKEVSLGEPGRSSSDDSKLTTREGGDGKGTVEEMMEKRERERERGKKRERGSKFIKSKSAELYRLKQEGQRQRGDVLSLKRRQSF